MQDCVICQLVALTIPSWVVYEDESVIAFLPLEVESYGHTLVAPKAHFADLLSTPTERVVAVIGVVQTVARHYEKAIGASGFNLLHASGTSAQQSVPHLHFHLIPRFDRDGLNAWPQFPGTTHSKDKLLAILRLPSSP